MMAAVTPRIPPSDLVAAAFIKALLGTAAVGTSLPSSFTDVYLTVRTVGGVPSQESGKRETVVTVDAWAAGGTQARPRWSAAHDPISRLEEALTGTRPDIFVQPTNIAANYRQARVFSSTRMLTVPQRVEGDPSGYARIMADIALDWTLD